MSAVLLLTFESDVVFVWQDEGEQKLTLDSHDMTRLGLSECRDNRLVNDRRRLRTLLPGFNTSALRRRLDGYS